jgi:hypothetical protein
VTTASRSGGFEGDLHALSVVEIVQTLNLASRTARLTLRSGAQTGEMWLEGGALTHAAAGALFGELAVYAMIEWTSGRFEVEYGVTCDRRSISGDTTFLLIDGLRRADERSSDAAPKVEAAGVPAGREADVRSQRAVRRLVLGGTALVLVAGAIAAASFRKADPPPAAPAEPVPAAAPDPTPQRDVPRATPALKRSAPARAKHAQAQPAEPPPAAVAPESALAEEPIPSLAVATAEIAAGESQRPPPAARASSRVVISLHCGAGGGRLTVLLDGQPVFERAQLDEAETPDTAIDVPAGDHRIIARLDSGPESGVHEASVLASFAGGETRQLRITANRMFGAPVKVKLV